MKISTRVRDITGRPSISVRLTELDESFRFGVDKNTRGYDDEGNYGTRQVTQEFQPERIDIIFTPNRDGDHVHSKLQVAGRRVHEDGELGSYRDHISMHRCAGAQRPDVLQALVEDFRPKATEALSGIGDVLTTVQANVSAVMGDTEEPDEPEAPVEDDEDDEDEDTEED